MILFLQLSFLYFLSQLQYFSALGLKSGSWKGTKAVLPYWGQAQQHTRVHLL